MFNLLSKARILYLTAALLLLFSAFLVVTRPDVQAQPVKQPYACDPITRQPIPITGDPAVYFRNNPPPKRAPENSPGALNPPRFGEPCGPLKILPAPRN